MSREIRITSRKLTGHQARYSLPAEAGDRVVVSVGNRRYRPTALRLDESISDSEAVELALDAYLVLSNDR